MARQAVAKECDVLVAGKRPTDSPVHSASDETLVLSTAEVSGMLRVRERTVKRMIRAGKIDGIKLGRNWFVLKHQFLQRFGNPKADPTSDYPYTPVPEGNTPADSSNRDGLSIISSIAYAGRNANAGSSSWSMDRRKAEPIPPRLSARQAERYFPLTAKQLVRLARQNRIKHKHENGRWYFAPEWIEEYLSTPDGGGDLQ